MKAVDALNTADAEVSQNARATPRVSSQRSAGASGPGDSAHQGDWKCPSRRRPVLAAMRMARCAASSRAIVRRLGAYTILRTSRKDRGLKQSHHARSALVIWGGYFEQLEH